MDPAGPEFARMAAGVTRKARDGAPRARILQRSTVPPGERGVLRPYPDCNGGRYSSTRRNSDF